MNGKKVADSSAVAGAYRTYDFDVTDFVQAGGKNVLAVETFAPAEKDLGINWVDWNPCPPDKDMGLIGEVNLVETGAVALRSPMAVTHFTDPTLKTAELTIYAELHNGADHEVQGRVEGTAAGAHFEQPVTLASHEDKTVVFSPEQFPQLKLRDPEPWWPAQMGTPHLEQLTLSFETGSFETGSFETGGAKSDEKTVRFGIREITSELITSMLRDLAPSLESAPAVKLHEGALRRPGRLLLRCRVLTRLCLRARCRPARSAGRRRN